MRSVNSFVDSVCEDNLIFVNAEKSHLDNSKVNFYGRNNILFVEDGVTLRNSTINFNKDNSVVYLSSNRHNYLLNCSVNNGNSVYIGKDCYINGVMNLIASEGKNIIVGDDGLFSFGIWVRTADPHLVYDVNSKERINYSQSVMIGDHVWLGQQSLILKGSQIGSGSVLGGGTIVAGKRLFSNSAYGGNPAKLIREGIFFSSECVHGWTEKETRKYETMQTEQWIYSADGKQQNFADLDKELQVQKSAELRLKIIQKVLVENKRKNRFYIGNE